MMWVLLAMGVTGGLVAGFFFGAWVMISSMKDGLQQASREKAGDQDLLMHTFRRELANYLFRADPDRYHALYERARTEEADILAGHRKSRGELLTRIASNKQLISDFDLVGAREFVLYTDALNMYSYEEIEEHYLDIVRWQAIQRADNSAWMFRHNPTSDGDLNYLPNYKARYQDSRLLERLERTMGLYWFSRQGSALRDVDNDFFSVSYVHHIAENRYGIHLKDTDEYGLFWTFDDDRHFEGYLRSNADFTEEKCLDLLVLEAEPPRPQKVDTPEDAAEA